uniref:Peptidoglycan recognition protein 1 n=1 Tax=Mytilus galloprovincialis TaxID=29158 RepID=A0A0C5PIX8_MYTGA|nr:peptidoglycan recognition protein 1 [Mytilus galloprovincialis]
MTKMEFDNVKKQNRISVLFALEYLSEGINKFAADEFQNHHNRLVKMMQHLNYSPCARSCSKISKNEQSWCRTCSGWRTTILSSHKNRSSIGKKGSDWSKIDSSKWPTDATEVERCYQPDWSITMTGPNAGDISILIGKLINCSDIRSLFANTVDPDCIRVIRNKIVHNSGEISPAEKKQYCQQMLDFLRTPEVWLYQEAKDAYSKIQLFMRYDYIELIKNKTIEDHELNKLKERIKARTTRVYNLSRISTLVLIGILAVSLIYVGFERTCYRVSIVSVCLLLGALLLPTIYLGFLQITKSQLYAYVVIFMDRLLFVEQLEDEISGDISMVTRGEWRARLPKSIEFMEKPVMNVLVHHTAGLHGEDTQMCSQIVRSIQNLHMDDNKWDDVGYNFLIGEDGCVYEGRGWNKVGAHTLGWNKNSVAFAFLGNYNDRRPKPLALKALRGAISYGIKNGHISPYYTLYGHRDKRPTDSPGNYLYAEIRNFKHYHHK